MNRGIKKPPRVPSQVKNELFFSRKDKFPKRSAKEIRRDSGEVVQFNDKNAVSSILCINGRNSDSLPHHFFCDKVFRAFSSDFKNYCCSDFATDYLYRFVHFHMSGICIIDGDYLVSGKNACTLRWCAFEGCNNGEYVISEAYFHTHSAKIAVDIFLKYLCVSRWQKDRIRVFKRTH